MAFDSSVREVDAFGPEDAEVDAAFDAPAGLAPPSRDTFDVDVAAIEGLILPAHEELPLLKIAVYAQPGFGKTWLAATFPSVLIVDCNEQGSKFIPDEGPRKGAKVFHATSLRQIVTLYWYLRMGNHPYKSVAIDTVTSLADMVKGYILHGERDPDIFSDGVKRATLGTWTDLSDIMGMVLMWYRDLPMNVIYLVNERKQTVLTNAAGFEEDDVVENDSSVPSIFPDLTPAVRSRLYRCVDIMARMRLTKEVVQRNNQSREVLVRRLYPKSNPDFQAKDRSDRLPSVMVNPTFEKIDKALRGVKAEGGSENAAS